MNPTNRKSFVREEGREVLDQRLLKALDRDLADLQELDRSTGSQRRGLGALFRPLQRMRAGGRDTDE